jgi:hypothetical protein
MRILKNLPKEYKIKVTPIGWWVDGKSGYCVSGYFTTRREAIKEALKRINEVRQNDSYPSWRY